MVLLCCFLSSSLFFFFLSLSVLRSRVDGGAGDAGHATIRGSASASHTAAPLPPSNSLTTNELIGVHLLDYTYSSIIAIDLVYSFSRNNIGNHQVPRIFYG